MERMLQKLAQQLNAYDEASLMSLWDRYAAVVDRFEPTKRWEEASLVLCLIQAVRWKNQLFNHHWGPARGRTRGGSAAHGLQPRAGARIRGGQGRPRPRRRASGRKRCPEAAQGAQLPAARGRLAR